MLRNTEAGRKKYALTKSISRSNLQISCGKEINLLLFANKTSSIGRVHKKAGNVIS